MKGVLLRANTQIRTLPWDLCVTCTHGDHGHVTVCLFMSLLGSFSLFSCYKLSKAELHCYGASRCELCAEFSEERHTCLSFKFITCCSSHRRTWKFWCNFCRNELNSTTSRAGNEVEFVLCMGNVKGREVK